MSHTRKGDEYVHQEKYEEAFVEYMNAVRASPEDTELRWKFAKVALELKNYRAAFPNLKKTVELNPDNYEAKGKLGELYLAAGKMEEAREIADDFINNRPDDPQGYILQSVKANWMNP
ncbi:MAG: tetratricopeptide repeat protein [Deltaproteobacteria bacterium]|nr:tetratricopeptide repeat protein [Deltaproteobacteria bacterium]